MQFILVTFLCVLGAVTYGIVHDQVTVRVCLEYFTIADAAIVFWTIRPSWISSPDAACHAYRYADRYPGARMNVDKNLQTETANNEVRDKDTSTDGGASGMLTFGVTFILFFVLAALVITGYLIWGHGTGTGNPVNG